MRIRGRLARLRSIPCAISALAILSLYLPGLMAQETGMASFDTASIRPAAPNARGNSIAIRPGGKLIATHINLRRLIGFAYKIGDSEILAGPNWIDTEWYDIAAESDAAPFEETVAGGLQEAMRQRLRGLLADRFRLSVHRETRILPMFALEVATRGPKLQASAEGAGALPTVSQRAVGELYARNATMWMLAAFLTDILARPVVDKTELRETFDFTLKWTYSAQPNAGEQGLVQDAGGPSIFTAVQEQLGLRLKSQRGPVQTIVIDRAEHPSDN